MRLITLFLPALLLAQTDYPTPQGWTAQEQPGLLSFQPSSVPAGQTIRAEVSDPEDPSGSASDWLQARVEAAGAAAGMCRPVYKKSGYNCIVKYDRQDHFFYAVPFSGGRVRLVHFIMAPNSTVAVSYVRPFAEILSAAGKSEAHSSVTAPAQTPVAEVPQQTQLSSDAWFEAPIVGIYLHESYGGGVGGMVTINYEPYVVLTDGSITEDLDFAPQSDADVAKWRTRKPRDWGTWTKSGSKLTIRWNDPRRKPETWDKWFVARPGNDGMPLTGLYRSMGGGGNTALGGNIMIAAWKDFKFSPGGTVVTGGGSGSMNSGPGASVATSSQKRPGEAAYRVHNHALRLRYADGRTETRWFYRFPDSDDVLGIGSSNYIKD